MKTVLLYFVLFGASVATAFAQVTPVDTTTGKPYYILLKDGSHIYGRIVRRDSAMYTVRTRNGQLTYVEKELYSRISGFQPVLADSAAYFTQTTTTQPGQMTTSPGQYVVTLADGTVLTGEVLSQDSSRLVLRTATIGTVYVPAAQVLRLERANAVRRSRRGVIHPEEGYPNLFPQYLNATPTAYQAEPGRFYYRNTMFYVNQFDAGITRNWSLGVGLFTPIVPVLAGWLTTKVSVPLGPRARVGVQGQLLLGTLTLFDTQSFGLNYVQGVVSLGEPQNNFTVGLGTSFGENTNGGLLTVGLVRKIKPLLTFVGEGQLIIGEQAGLLGRVAGGLRLDRERHSFDLLANILVGTTNSYSRSSTSFSVFPWASYQVRLGK